MDDTRLRQLAEDDYAEFGLSDIYDGEYDQEFRDDLKSILRERDAARAEIEKLQGVLKQIASWRNHLTPEQGTCPACLALRVLNLSQEELSQPVRLTKKEEEIPLMMYEEVMIAKLESLEHERDAACAENAEQKEQTSRWRAVANEHVAEVEQLRKALEKIKVLEHRNTLPDMCPQCIAIYALKSDTPHVNLTPATKGIE